MYDTQLGSNKDKIALNSGIVVPLTRRKLSSADSDIIQNVAPINIHEENSSRLVPTYRLSALGSQEVGLEICRNKQVKDIIEETLFAEIQERGHAFRRY